MSILATIQSVTGPAEAILIRENGDRYFPQAGDVLCEGDLLATRTGTLITLEIDLGITVAVATLPAAQMQVFTQDFVDALLPTVTSIGGPLTTLIDNILDEVVATGEANTDATDCSASNPLNDRVFATESVDVYNAGLGVDTLLFTSSDAGVTVDLSSGDFVSGHADGDLWIGFERVIGSQFGDVLIADDSGINLVGGGGDDTLTGGLGDDVLVGGAGADTLMGGAGVDLISYRASTAGVNVDLDTGAVSGGHAAGDVISAVENVVGSLFADDLVGDDGDNKLYGVDGADTLSGGLGRDLLSGGAGADTLYGGDGFDTASYTDSAAGVIIDLIAGTGNGGDAAGDTLTDIERVVGSSQDDEIYGDDNDNVLAGGAGNDTIDGRGGRDILLGEAGADHLIGGDGSDTASYRGSLGAVNVNLDANNATGGDAQGDRFDGIENLRGSAFDDALTGDALANILTGDEGNDSLFGGQGNDVLIGGAGMDIIAGGSGLDTARYHLSDAAIDVDLTRVGQLGGDAQGDQLTGIERIEGSAFDDVLAGDGDANRLIGAAGNDTLNGRGGNDVIYGGAGDDVFVFAAGDGRDSLREAAGNDRVEISGYASDAANFAVNTTDDSLRITFDGSNDLLVLRGSGTEGNAAMIETIYFAADDVTIQTVDLL